MRNHKKDQRALSLILLIIPVLFSACKPSIQENTSQVTVSILPQAYFIERISGGAISVNVMVGPGEEAHTYEPTPEQMKSLAQSVFFFTIGVEYEEVWVPRFEEINPDLEIINSANGIQHIPLSTDHDHHDEDDGEQHLDPHVWLSPENGRIIAENILLALSSLMPDSAELFQDNYDNLIADIEVLDTHIKETLDGLDRQKFMVFHPAWGYFAEQYNLEQIPVQVGGQDPSASEMASLIHIAQDEGIKVVFVQPTFNTASAEAIAQEINGEVAIVNPLAEDWLSNLEIAAEAFASALKDLP